MAEEKNPDTGDKAAESGAVGAEATDVAKTEEPKSASEQPSADTAKPAQADTADVVKTEEPKSASEQPSADAAKPAQADAASPGSGDATDGDPQGADATAEAAPARRARARGGRVVSAGVAHIRATFNNTIISITDPRGGVVAWSSSGRAGFKGSRKCTAFAATMVGQDAARQAVGRGMHEVEVRIQGAGAGRESAIRALQSAGLSISVIKDVTPVPHNGCRPRKRRRV